MNFDPIGTRLGAQYPDDNGQSSWETEMKGMKEQIATLSEYVHGMKDTVGCLVAFVLMLFIALIVTWFSM